MEWVVIITFSLLHHRAAPTSQGFTNPQRQATSKSKVFPVHTMKAFRGNRSVGPFILGLGTSGGERWTSRSGPFILGKEQEAGWTPESIWAFWRREQFHVAVANKLCTVAPNICSSIWNLLHATLLAATILRWLLDFWKIFAPLSPPSVR